MVVGGAQLTLYSSLTRLVTRVVGKLRGAVRQLKPSTNTSCSQNYRTIALASILSKILEHLILTRYEYFFNTSCLQFGFKPGLSTSFVYWCIEVLSRITSIEAQQFLDV